MLILEQAAKDSERWEEVIPAEKNGGAPFSVKLREPTYAELCRDIDTPRNGDSTLQRIRTVVVDWSGIGRKVTDTTDKDNPVEKIEPLPFSQDALARLCEKNRGVFIALVNLSLDLYVQDRAETAKNLPEPSGQTPAG
ncbi:hypothetical protein [Alienimonas sp. DA493]|uniref:hypothetical protein n=1 Tax=Alienimonas sp. DA493 TaxID=3373605 RepID=UPI0037553930